MPVSEEDSSDEPEPDESEEESDSEVEPELGPRDAYTETLSLKMGGSGRGHFDYGFGLSFDQSSLDSLSQNAETGTDSSGSEDTSDESEDTPPEDDDSEPDDPTAPEVSADQITAALGLTFHLNTSGKDKSNSSLVLKSRGTEVTSSGHHINYSSQVGGKYNYLYEGELGLDEDGLDHEQEETLSDQLILQSHETDDWVFVSDDESVESTEVNAVWARGNLDLRLSDGVTLSDEGADIEIEDTYEDRLTIRTLNEQSHYTTDLSPNPQPGVATYVHGELITTDWRQTGLTPEGATGTEDWSMVQWTDEADFGVTPERHFNLESESTTFDPFGEEVVEDEEEPLPDDEPGGPSTPPQQEDEVVSGLSVYLYTGYWTTTKSVYDAAIGAAAEDLTNNEAREVLRVGAEIDPTFIFPTVNAVINGGIEGKTVGEMGTEIAVAVVPFPIPKKITKAVGIAPKTGLPVVNGKFVPDYWRMKPTARGTLIEDALAKSDYADWFRVGQLDNGYFPLVDFQKGLDFVSLKTVNTNGRSWLYSMRRHIDDLAEAEAGVGDQVGRIILDIRVQPGGTSAAQSLIEYGRKIGIPVIIKEFP